MSDGSAVADVEDDSSTSAVSIGAAPSSGRNVENASNPVRDWLFDALAKWTTAQDVATLRRTLLAILVALE